jgi:hypothetical protein
MRAVGLQGDPDDVAGSGAGGHDEERVTNGGTVGHACLGDVVGTFAVLPPPADIRSERDVAERYPHARWLSSSRARMPRVTPRAADPPRRLFLLDGHSLSYRAFFALPPSLATTSGQVTNAVYGFTSMLIKLLAEERPDLIAVAFDVGKPTVRLDKVRGVQGGPARDARRVPPAARADRRGAGDPSDPGDRHRGPRGG